MMKTNLGLYIHIPFCEKKCNYCDFNSSNYSKDIQSRYIEALISEIKTQAKNYKNYYADSVFIGGGTPSTLSFELLESLVIVIKEVFNFAEDIEFTIEVNPNSLDIIKLAKYLELGINRLSIGGQSFIDSELEILGRLHKSRDIYRAVEDARLVGFENINLDLMTGIPYQTLESFKFSLNKAINLGLNHISAYSLIIEDGTFFGNNYDFIERYLPSEDEEREIYHYLVDRLNEKGYYQYEISNFSRLNKESRHNKKYWLCQDYLGLGLGAHSRIGVRRFENFSRIEEYIKAIESGDSAIECEADLSLPDQLNEKIIMGLRLNNGLDIKEINDSFKIDFMDFYSEEVKKNLENGLIFIESQRIKLSKKGRDFSNQVELDFYRLGD